MEEASSSGAKATELRAKLDAELGEHGETKMRLQSETAANAGLRDAVMETNEVRFPHPLSLCVFVSCVCRRETCELEYGVVRGYRGPPIEHIRETCVIPPLSRIPYPFPYHILTRVMDF